MSNFETRWNLIWTAVGAIGTSVGALATFAAVAVALWQTVFSHRTKLKLRFDYNLGSINVSKNETVRYIGLIISNVGNKPVQIYKWGFDLCDGAAFNFGNELDALKLQKVKLPYTLPPGESFRVYFSQNNFNKEVTSCIQDGALNNPSKPLRFFVYDYRGIKYYVKDKVPASAYMLTSEVAANGQNFSSKINIKKECLPSDLQQTIVQAVIDADREINKPQLNISEPLNLRLALKKFLHAVVRPSSILANPNTPTEFLSVILYLTFKIFWFISFVCFFLYPVYFIGMFLGVCNVSLDISLFLNVLLWLGCGLFSAIFNIIAITFERYKFPTTYLLGYTAIVLALLSLFV